MNSSYKKELWCCEYQYAIWISCRTDNRLCGDVPYFLWNGTRPSYKHIKIWGVRVYIINRRATRKKLDYCRNMSGHALMGRPAARLETMALVFISYVFVCFVDKRRWLSLYGCYFLIYVMILPCSLEKLLTMNQKLFNIWLHVQTYHSSNLTKVSYLVQ